MGCEPSAALRHARLYLTAHELQHPRRPRVLATDLSDGFPRRAVFERRRRYRGSHSPSAPWPARRARRSPDTPPFRGGRIRKPRRRAALLPCAPKHVRPPRTRAAPLARRWILRHARLEDPLGETPQTTLDYRHATDSATRFPPKAAGRTGRPTSCPHDKSLGRQPSPLRSRPPPKFRAAWRSSVSSSRTGPQSESPFRAQPLPVLNCVEAALMPGFLRDRRP